MTAKSQLIEKPVKAKTAPAKGRAMARARGVAGNHTLIEARSRADKFEYQAEDAATRIMRGEQNVAQRLSPAPASSLTVNASRGEPLPDKLRIELEESFGAELSQVRLHRNAAASAAANAYNAHAVTAGRDIFFSSGAYEPFSQEGRLLLLHEVAHTLQQTGRRSSDGRMVVTDVASIGQPQCAGRTSPLPSTSAIPDFDAMLARHLASADATDTALLKKTAQIKKERDEAIQQKNEDGYWERLEFEVTTNNTYDERTVSRSIRSFIYDCMKLAGRWNAVAHLLSRDIRLQTTFYSAKAYETFPEDKGFDFLTSIWTNDKFFEPYGQERFIFSIVDYLIGPTRDVPNLGAQKFFEPIAEAKLKERENTTGLIGNELFFVTLKTLHEVDKLRHQKIGELAGEVAPRRALTHLTPDERIKVAVKIEKWGQKLRKDQSEFSKSSTEVRAFFKELAPGIETSGKIGQNFWNMAQQLEQSGGLGTIEGVGDVRKLFERLARTAEFVSLSADLVTFSRDLFLLTKEGDPQPIAEYTAARDKFASGLRKDVQKKFELKLLSFFHNNKADIGLVVGYAWIMQWMYILIGILEAYDPGADKAFEDKYRDQSGKGPADIRIDHRIRLALKLWHLAERLGWRDLKQIAEQVITQKGQPKSLLALLSDWEIDSSAPISKMSEEIGADRTIAGLEPLTAGNVVTFFQMNYFKLFADQIEALLKAEQKSFDPKKEPVLTRAYQAAASFERPQRYFIRDFNRAIRPEDAATFGSVVAAHPKTQAFLWEHAQDDDENPGQKKKPEAILPLEAVSSIFIWVLPPLRGLIFRMRQVDGFNRLIYKNRMAQAKAAEEKEPDLKPIYEMRWFEWFKALRTAIEQQGAQSAIVPEAEFWYNLKTDSASERERLLELMRKASIFDRSNRAGKVLNPLILDYNRFDEFNKGINGRLRYEIPNIVLEQISAIISHTAPMEDQSLHLAALILELSGAMVAKFMDSPRFDLMNGLLPALDETIKLVEKDPAVLTPVLTTTEKADAKWVSTRLADVKTLADKMRKSATNVQEQFGIQGVSKGDTQFLIGVGQGYKILVGEQFTIGGVDYNLVEVVTTFIFHPKHGPLGSILLDENNKPIPRDASHPLVKVQYGGGKTKTLSGADEELLTDLSMAVALEAIRRQLDDLQTFIKGATELTMELVEFIPGAGQVVMASRLALAVLQFVVSEEFDQLVDFLMKNPTQAIKMLVDLIFTLLKPNMLWEYVLFGNNAFDQLHASPAPPTGKKVPKTTTAKLARVVGRLYNFGKGFLGALGRTQTHVRWKTETVELFVLGRPLLAWALRLVADYIDIISALSRDAYMAGQSVSDYEKKIEDALRDWPTKVIETVNTLRKMELPDELIPLSEIIEIIVSIILERLPLKYRIASNVIMFLLDKFGKKDAIFQAIADEIKNLSADADPNKLWREVRDEKIKEPLRKARNELAYEIFNALAGASILTDAQRKTFSSEAQSVKTDTQFETATGEFPEMDKYAPEPQRPARRPSKLSVPKSGGQPLQPSLRGQAERKFGHDFGHVRVHTGPTAASFTNSLGAEALTSGSNVYLGDGITPGSSHGSWIVNHELTHVLQQTGARPVGRPHNSTPVQGRPGRGVVYDSAREAAASRVADSMQSGGRARSLSFGSGRSEGLQPSLMIDVTRRLLEDLTGTADVEKDEAAEEKTGKGAGLKKVPASVKEQISGLWANFQTVLNSSNTSFKPPFNSASPDVPKMIRKHLTSRVKTEGAAGEVIEGSFDDLTIDSLDEKKVPPKQGSQGKEKIVYTINTNRFGVALSRFVLAEAGILIRFKIKELKKEKDPVEIESMEVVYVHLAEIYGGLDLWQKAIDKVLAGKDHSKYLPRLRAVLASKGPSIGVWESASYQLEKKVIDEVDEVIAAATKGGLLDKSQLPAPASYLNPKGGSPHIGLRLGLYNDTTSVNQTGVERESHHITQYLLLEYFTNTCPDNKAFPLLEHNTTIYPGLTATGKNSDARAAAFQKKGAKKMDLAGYVAKRGGKMPAVLIAQPVHRKARLHVTTQADDWTANADSPSGVVNLKFREMLTARDPDYGNAQDAGVKKFEEYKKNAEQRKGPGTVEATIYSAMQDTYHWMRDFMQPRLRDGLKTVEVKYYNELSKEKGSTDELSPGEMDIVYSAAVVHNADELAKGGWI
jgi:hypothetical protein